MENALNERVSFESVRWAINQSCGYDCKLTFSTPPNPSRFPEGTSLFRFVPIPTGRYFGDVWWITKDIFDMLRNGKHAYGNGGGGALQYYAAQGLAIPRGSSLLSVVEIQLVRPVFAWRGIAAAMNGEYGGLEQIFLPNLAERGNTRYSPHAKLVQTYWLQFGDV